MAQFLDTSITGSLTLSGSLTPITFPGTNARIEIGDPVGTDYSMKFRSNRYFYFQDNKALYVEGVIIPRNGIRDDGGPLALGHKNTNIMYLSGSSVGIGTSTPDYKLDVAGEVGIDSYIRHNGDSNSYFGFSSDDNYKIRLGGGDRMTMSTTATIFTTDTTSTGYLQTYGRFYHREHFVVLNNAGNGWIQWATRDTSGTEAVIDLANIGSISAESQTISGDLTVGGTVTAEEFHTEFVSASIMYSSGSTKFGDTVDDDHNFTGSINLLAQSGATGLDIKRGSNIYMNLNNSSTRNEFNFKSSTGLRFYHGTDSTSPLFISSSGNVGINTTTPSVELTVAGDIQATGGNLYVDGTFPRIWLRDSNSNPDYSIINGNGTFRIYDDTNSADRFAISTTGNVGIGTTSPTVALQVEGDISASGYLKGDTLYALNDVVVADKILHYGDTDTYIQWNTDQIDLYAGNVRMLTLSEGSTDIVTINDGGVDVDFRVEGDSDADLIRTDAANDRVGIGQSTPIEKLHVDGNIHIEAESNSLGAAGLYFGISNSRYLAIRQTSTQKDFAIDTYNGTESWVNRLTIRNAGGNVGIGTAAPSHKLHVSGTYDVVKIEGSGSANSSSLFEVHGNNGLLFAIDDDLSDSLFSVNTIAGLPVIEAFSDNRVVMGAFNQNDFVISGSNVAVGTGSFDRKFTVADGAKYVSIGDKSGFSDSYGPILETNSGNIVMPSLVYLANSNAYIQRSNGRLRLHGDYGLELRYWDGSVNQTAMFISQSGNIGIDTDTPEAQLHISGATPQLFVGKMTGGSNNGGIYDDDHIVVGEDGSISIGAERRGDYGLNASTATSTTFRSRLNIWSDNEDHITFGGANTHIVQAWDEFKIWINNDSANTGVLKLYNTNAKTEFARFAGGAHSYLNGGNFSIGTTSAYTTGGTAKLSIAGGGPLTIGASNSDLMYIRKNATGKYQLQTYNNGNSGEIHLQPYGGSVGIGTTAPSQKLEVRDGNLIVSSSTSEVVIGTVSTKPRMQSNGNQDLLFSTPSYTNLLYLQESSGKVGIGTTSPNKKLTVEGAVSASGGFYGDGSNLTNITLSSTLNQILANGNQATSYDIDMNQNDITAVDEINANIFNGTSASLSYITASADLFIDTNVGIGVPSPVNTLHVRSNSQQIAIDRTDGTGALWRFYSWADGLNIFPNAEKDIFIGRDGSNTDLQLHNGVLRVLGTGNSYFTGNVGVGTTTPEARLHVQDGDLIVRGNSSPSIKVQAIDASSPAMTANIELRGYDGRGKGIYLTESGSLSGREIFFGSTYSGNNSNFSIGYADGGGQSEYKAQSKFYVDLINEEVGIGTSNPTAVLHITASNSDGRYIKMHGGSSGHSLEIVDRSGYTTATPNVYIQDADNNGARASLRITGNNGAIESMFVASNGYTGLGTVTPSYKLDVTGDIRATETLLLPGDGTSTRETLINAHGTRGKLMKEGNATYWQVAQGGNYFEITDAANGNDTKGNVMLRVHGNDANDNEIYLAVNGGKVGIGTTSPSQPLTVQGNISSSATVLAVDGKFSGFVGANNNQTRDKFRVWNDGAYAIGMKSGFTYGHIGNDYAMSFQMNNSSTRGFWWGDSGHTDAQGAMSLTTNGRLTVAASLSVGQGQSITSPSTETLYVDGNATITGIVTAQEFHTEFVSASIVFQSGSTKFGDTVDDIHSFTGSLEVSGSGNFSTHIGNPSSPYGGDDQFIRLISPNGTTGTLVNADNGNTWLNADGGKDLWLNWYSLNSPTSNADLQVGDGEGGSAILTVAGSSRRVGINDTTPDYPLDVVGQGHFESDNASGSLVLSRTSNSDQKLFLRGGNGSGEGWVAAQYRLELRAGVGGNTSHDLLFSTAAGEAMRIDASNSNYVGIGKNNPSYTLDVTGDIRATGDLRADDDIFIAGNTLRFTNDAASAYIQSVDTLYIEADSDNDDSGGKPIIFRTAGTTKMTLAGDGKLGIGTTAPSASLQIGSGTSNSGNRSDVMIIGKSNAGGVVNALSLVNTAAGANSNGTAINFHNGNSWSPTGRIITQQDASGTNTNSNMQFYTYTGGLNERMRITSDGKVGIGTTAPGYTLDVNGSMHSTNITIADAIYHEGDTNTYMQFSTDQIDFYAGGLKMLTLDEDTIDTVVINQDGANINFRVESDTDTHALFVDGATGNVGIGVSAPGAALSVDGIIEATEKSFNIAHPTKEGKRLIYGVLEGPEHGVYVRGKSTEKVIELPEVWTGLVHEDSITVQLTCKGKPFNIWVEDIRDNKVYINTDVDEFEFFYYVQGERKDVNKLIIERDAD